MLMFDKHVHMYLHTIIPVHNDNLIFFGFLIYFNLLLGIVEEIISAEHPTIVSQH